MQNYPYIMPMYQPNGYRYQQPPVMQPQANVDWVQVAWIEAAKAQQMEQWKTPSAAAAATNDNTMKNNCRKSALRIIGSTPQAIGTTPSALSGVISLVDTWCSMEDMSSGSRICTAGLC